MLLDNVEYTKEGRLPILDEQEEKPWLVVAQVSERVNSLVLKINEIDVSGLSEYNPENIEEDFRFAMISFKGDIDTDCNVNFPLFEFRKLFIDKTGGVGRVILKGYTEAGEFDSFVIPKSTSCDVYCTELEINAITYSGANSSGEVTANQFNNHVNNHSNPHVVTKAQIGLSNVNNTSDLNKPISNAEQGALDLKAPLLSPALTGTPTAPTPTTTDSSTKIATTALVAAKIAAALAANNGNGLTEQQVMDAITAAIVATIGGASESNNTLGELEQNKAPQQRFYNSLAAAQADLANIPENARVLIVTEVSQSQFSVSDEIMNLDGLGN